MIAISDLEFQFPQSDFRLAVPSLKIAVAERVAIVGPSGSGKTTLLHLICGILSPSRGTIRVGGREMNALGDAARRAFRVAQIGLAFQNFELVGYLDVFENITLPYRLNPALRLTSEVARRAVELMEETGNFPPAPLFSPPAFAGRKAARRHLPRHAAPAAAAAGRRADGAT